MKGEGLRVEGMEVRVLGLGSQIEGSRFRVRS